MHKLMALFLLLGTTTSFAGDIYRWQDKSGVWHFGDRPPTGTQAETIEQRRMAGDADPSAQAQLRAQENELARQADLNRQLRGIQRQYDASISGIEERAHQRKCDGLRSEQRFAQRWGDDRGASTAQRQHRMECQ